MMCLLDLALGSLYSRGPVYSWPDAGDDAVEPFSHSRSFPGGARPGEMGAEGDAARLAPFPLWVPAASAVTVESDSVD